MDQTALFVMPLPVAGNLGPVAPWITASQWAEAARRRFGRASLLTPEGWLSPEDALTRASARSLKPTGDTKRRSFVLGAAETGVKDVRRAVRARRLRKAVRDGGFATNSVCLVWQYHFLFENSGSVLARRFGVPLVQRVNAPQVWEAKRWGVARPLWGGILENIAEKPQLAGADLVACVSDEVADVVSSKFRPNKVVVAPNGVDTQRFSPSVSGDEVRRRHRLEDKFVMGWTGSFRPFHGLEMAVRAAAELRPKIPNLALLLVGDGPTRPRLEDLARSLKIDSAVFTGTVGLDEVPSHVAAMDVAIMPDSGESGFHYSPVKLLEYMSAGKPVVAAAAGQVEMLITDGVNGRLTSSGDVKGFARATEELHADPQAAREMGRAARDTVIRGWTWDQQFEKVLLAL